MDGKSWLWFRVSSSSSNLESGPRFGVMRFSKFSRSTYHVPHGLATSPPCMALTILSAIAAPPSMAYVHTFRLGRWHPWREDRDHRPQGC